MRYTKYKWMMWLLLLCFSCVNDEQRAVLPNESGKVQMNMSISTCAEYDPEILNENETRISRLRLYVFDGSTLDKMYYWSHFTVNDGIYVTPTFLVKAATGKTFYAIANEPTDMDTRALLEAVDHPNDLAEIQYKRTEIMDYWNPNIIGYYNDYCLPMYGELAGVDALEGAIQTVNLQVDRAVARVDVYMRREIGQDENYLGNRLYVDELSVERISDIGFIAPVRLPDSRDENIHFKDGKEIREEICPDDKGELLYSFYVPEMECKYDKLSLDFHYRYEDGYEDCACVELGEYNSYPQGEILEKIKRNHVYKLFCRFTPKKVSLELNLTVCPWEYLSPQTEEVKGDVKMTNCYMVAPGGRVDIPTENVYKIWAQQAEFGNIPIPEGNVTAEIVWQDEQGVIADEGITVNNASERDRANLQIRTAKKGNAVVAMKVNGEIYWSWHIWCTDYEPNVVEGQKVFNNLVWMDRNLGAMTNEYTSDGSVKGLFYQWGRKDPFPASEGWTEQEKILYTLTGTTTLSYKEIYTSNNLVEAIRQPARFFISSTTLGDWYTNSMSLLNRTLWLPNTKTIYDPCPVGWRVPGNQPWTGLDRGGKFHTSLNGFVHPDAGYFPCTGYRKPQTGKLYSLGNIVEWSANASSTNECYGLLLQSYGLLRQEWSTYWRADGRSVRCVKE